MYILGINGGVRSGNQDASACLLRDGKLVAASGRGAFSEDKVCKWRPSYKCDKILP